MHLRLALLCLLAACAKEVPPPPPAAAPPPPPVENAVDVAVPDVREAVAAAPASGPTAPDELRVRTPGSRGWTAVEVTCPSGFRTRFSLDPEGDSVSAAGSVRGLPNEECRLYFKGAGPVQYGPVRPGAALACTFAGTTAVCKTERAETNTDGGGPPIRLRYTGPSAAAVEVTCTDGQRQSAALIDGAATLEGLRPTAAPCTLRLLGTRRTEWGPVTPGMDLRCREAKGRLDCADQASTAAPPPVVPMAADMVEITMITAPGAQAIELVCPSGYRHRAPLNPRSATPPAAFGAVQFRSMPAEDCAIYVKGGPPARYAPVHGGTALACTVSGVTASCLPAAR